MIRTVWCQGRRRGRSRYHSTAGAELNSTGHPRSNNELAEDDELIDKREERGQVAGEGIVAVLAEYFQASSRCGQEAVAMLTLLDIQSLSPTQSSQACRCQYVWPRGGSDPERYSVIGELRSRRGRARREVWYRKSTPSSIR